ncbi:MAG: hypothetical protein JWO81_1077, partial [Alphaproteobacteria bacterium]|nr:hypothetical protein [Alphaproteobacteria bacterium]
MRSMVEGGERSAPRAAGPLHRTSCGPPPRPGEDYFETRPFLHLSADDGPATGAEQRPRDGQAEAGAAFAAAGGVEGVEDPFPV